MRAGAVPNALMHASGNGLDPSQLGALVWLDFSDASRLFTDNAATIPVTANGDRIRRVKAQPGFASGLENWYAGTHGGPATDTDRPIYQTSYRNGRDVVDFDTGTGDGILNLRNDTVGSALTDQDLGTIMCVFEMATPDTSDQKAPYGSTNGNGSQWNLRKSNDTPNPSGIRLQSHSGSTQTDDSTLSISGEAGKFFIHIMIVNKNDTTSKVRHYWNNVEDTNFTHNPTDAQLAVPSMYVGSRTPAGSTADADGWDAHILDFAVFDGVMGANDRTSLYNWANNKWTLNGSI